RKSAFLSAKSNLIFFWSTFNFDIVSSPYTIITQFHLFSATSPIVLSVANRFYLIIINTCKKQLFTFRIYNDLKHMLMSIK
ncbi:MAG: hypothetical protein SO009_03880, partial [Bacilli bacterium]|nr:hypothetical protein [Bacilli bacterium]